jgi:hypothetical protein
MRFRQHREGCYQIAPALASEDYQEYAGRKINIVNLPNDITERYGPDNRIPPTRPPPGIPIIAVIFTILPLLPLFEK